MIPLSQLNTHIELNRTFRKITKDDFSSDDADFRRAWSYGDSLSWKDIEASGRVILLSEAGSGKTFEIRNRAKILRDEGKHAFFLRLEYAAHESEPEDWFEPISTFTSFKQWQSSNSPCWLFLDSVDEARLKDPTDFERAIRRIGKLLGKDSQRTSIVISSRAEAWRPKSDLDICIVNLPALKERREPHPGGESNDPPEDEPQNIEYQIVALDELTRDQVKMFAEAKGVSKADKFLDEVERADAWPFTSRPQDLDELVAFWNTEEKIGGRLAIMENSVKRRLAERDPNRDLTQSIPFQTLCEGVQQIAAVMTLTGEQVIAVDEAESTQTISLKEILPNWNRPQIQSLLTKPIFDEAIYGGLRFHHRSVREFLASLWFEKLSKKSNSRRKFEGLFIRSKYNLKVIPPSLRPILTWLILRDQSLLEKVRATDPELIFEGGGPCQLPAIVRREILSQACESIAQGKASQSTASYSSIKRFAAIDISDEIIALFKKYRSNNDVKSFLLQLVWQGRLTSSLPLVVASCLETGANSNVVFYALSAINEIGDSESRKKVRTKLLSNHTEIERHWLAEAITGLPEDIDSSSWIIESFKKTPHLKDHFYDTLDHALGSYARSLHLPLLPKLLEGIRKLLIKKPYMRWTRESGHWGAKLSYGARAMEIGIDLTKRSKPFNRT